MGYLRGGDMVGVVLRVSDLRLVIKSTAGRDSLGLGGAARPCHIFYSTILLGARSDYVCRVSSGPTGLHAIGSSGAQPLRRRVANQETPKIYQLPQFGGSDSSHSIAVTVPIRTVLA